LLAIQRNGGSGGNRKIRESEEEMSGRKARWSRIEQLASNKKQENRKSTEAGKQESSLQNHNMAKSRNMSRYPIVLKDYGIVAYFAPGFRYNEQALVYSGLLADRGIPAALAGENAAFQPEDRP
jgi:hypothetical protein